jgi:protein-S-isoprenylcysteine O-methyltransferase Ste14
VALQVIHYVWLAIAIAGLLPFADAPFLTLGQTFTIQRSRARLILMSLELDLLALWAVAKFFFHWEVRLVPATSERALALAGLALTLAGAVLAAWAKFRLGKWFSATFGLKEGHELVTDGPYAVTRHPIYTGILLAILGSALTWNSTLTLILAALLAVPFFLHTVYEESLFEHHFGEAYFEYQKRVPRLVPFVRVRR